MHSFSSLSRRDFLQASALGMAAGSLGLPATNAFAQSPAPGDRPQQAEGVTVLNPRNRVPMSFIIDDSTCLANLAHFCIPQFAEVSPERYKQDWRKLPREIPDSFVRTFGEWCREHSVKGKYSIVPYPAMVGWVDKEMPGWSKRELKESIKLVRDFMMPDWDIHPEMITHTWVINTKTGRPYPERSENFMENWGWSANKSADELTDYLSYALKILKNAGLPCEGVTTPGGFGNRSLVALSQATLESCRDVFNAEIPHYFRHLFTDDRSVAPRVENASGLNSSDPKCAVSIIGCTGDWFGGWDGLTPGSVDRFITPDLKGGRLPEVIDKGEPAVLVCHWPGIYYNGEELGFNIFKEAVRRVHSKYDNLLWMKLSEIARYWAAKELTTIEKQKNEITFTAPFASPIYTVEVKTNSTAAPKITGPDRLLTLLKEVNNPLKLQTGTFYRGKDGVTVCFDLVKGRTMLRV